MICNRQLLEQEQQLANKYMKMFKNLRNQKRIHYKLKKKIQLFGNIEKI